MPGIGVHNGNGAAACDGVHNGNGVSKKNTGRLIREPIQRTGVLDHVKAVKLTPIIGTEFPEASLAEWLRAPDSDALIRELAVISSCHPALDLS